ncbi:PAS domain-containing sensor histidine kinase [Actinopolymorpha sp. B17G11]|uniref:PAS domain-containing sensor histidine kinase n=1 Tax=unclassified Actinopolymorpha TaxID=2627063 RepID=UPI0032D8FC1B
MSGIRDRRPDVPQPAAQPTPGPDQAHRGPHPPDEAAQVVEDRIDERLAEGAEEGLAETMPTATVDQDAGQVAVTATPDGIVAIGPDGIIRFCNPAAATLLGRRVHDLIGAPVGFPIVPHGSSEIDVVRPDGRASAVEIQITTTAWGNELLYIAAMRDVTHRRHAVRTLQAALDQRDVVIAVTAHELNDPLYAIALSLRLLRTASGKDERDELIDRIAERTEHLQTLVNKLRTASKIDAQTSQVSAEPVNVLEFVLERLGAFDRRYQDVELACSPDTVILVDRHTFSEMLANYLDNALAYGQPPIEVEVSEEGDDVEIRIRDHGPGVPKEFEPHLFERFRRGPEARQHADGTGLGLWIVRNLAQANGGEAWYEPDDDRPSFCLRLPRAPGQESAEPTPQPGRRERVSRSRRAG